MLILYAYLSPKTPKPLYITGVSALLKLYLYFNKVWCGKQDLKRLGTINLKQYKYPKALFFNDFFQFEKIWKNREKRQLHSQLHSNYIQKMSVTTLPVCIHLTRKLYYAIRKLYHAGQK